MSIEGSTYNAERALGIFAEAIADPKNRQTFLRDPDRAIDEWLGDRAGDLPRDILALLSRLQPAELDLLAELGDTLTKAGLYDTYSRSALVSLWKF
jgi:hypothetical protein